MFQVHEGGQTLSKPEADKVNGPFFRVVFLFLFSSISFSLKNGLQHFSFLLSIFPFHLFGSPSPYRFRYELILSSPEEEPVVLRKGRAKMALNSTKNYILPQDFANEIRADSSFLKHFFLYHYQLGISVDGL